MGRRGEGVASPLLPSAPTTRPSVAARFECRPLAPSRRFISRWGLIVTHSGRPAMRLMLAASVWMVLANPLSAFADGAMSAADWAIEKNQQLQSANFNLKCGRLNIEDDDVVWPDFCRTISGAELKMMILDDRAGPAGLRLRGVRILGKLDLSNAEIKHPVRIVESRIDGAIDLRDAHLAGSTYLAKVLAASGNRDDALDLQFAAREGERADAWETRNLVRWGWLCVLRRSAPEAMP
jgi:hypothetical protein